MTLVQHFRARSSVAKTRAQFIDIAMDDRDVGGFYVAAAGINSDKRIWRGAAIWRSLDNGQTFTEFVGLIRLQAAMGYVLRVEPDDSLIVEMLNESPELLSATAEQIANGANRAVLGELVVQYETVTLISPKTYHVTLVKQSHGGPNVMNPSAPEPIVGEEPVIEEPLEPMQPIVIPEDPLKPGDGGGGKPKPVKVGTRFLPYARNTWFWASLNDSMRDKPYWYLAQSSGTTQAESLQTEFTAKKVAPTPP